MVSIENEFHRGLLKRDFPLPLLYVNLFKCTVDRLGAQQCTCL